MELELIAVDPGERHVGIAIWTRQGGMRSYELAPFLALEAIEKQFRPLRPGLPKRQQLVVEEFRLYPDKAGAQSHKRMATSEMIGALRWIAKKAGVPVEMQGANIKIPTSRQCTSLRLEWRTDSIHAQDARLHAYHWLLKNEVIK